jgi:hypothetical protein
MELEHQSSFVVSRSFDDDFPSERSREPEPEVDPLPPPPMVMESTIEHHVAPVPEPSNGLDALRTAMIANFEQSDLDVPAFLRKRNETM